MTSQININIIWFKRDLRLHDHKPLWHAAQSGLPVLAVYIVEKDYWRQNFASRRHWHFIHDCLLELRTDLQKLGVSLIVRSGDVITIFEDLRAQYKINHIYAHEETGNGWTYERDKKVIKWCQYNRINFQEFPANGVVRRLKSRDDWSAIRNARMQEPLISKPSTFLSVLDIDTEEIPSKDHPMFGAPMPGIVQKGGRRAAIETLKTFLNDRGRDYLYRLSAPGLSEKNCSRLSSHLTWGTLSVREVIKATQKRRHDLAEDEISLWSRNLQAIESRLSWRCHFIQKLEDQPAIEFECMHPAFEGLRENDFNPEFYEAWKTGNMGYPFIDACMRNLIHEGWITFRMRAMLVSFASYHLWLDWRKTGYHLAQLFTDYEPGIHYSQLQMQSGVTGINAVRMYNPIKQSQEHDAHGQFIRKWIPALKNVSSQWIHEPWMMTPDLQRSSACELGKDYPLPIVDHNTAIKMARQKISDIRKQSEFRPLSQKVFDKLGSRKLPQRKTKKDKQKTNQISMDF
jgi:deoxyribodipyrimidine photo-lyase